MSQAPRANPAWSDVKVKLRELDRSELLKLLQDLYNASNENKAFLHARLSVGGDVLRPYKEVIDRWLWPDPFKQQVVSVAKAKKAISDYKNAAAVPAGLAELTVYFCERAAGFASDVGLQDEPFFLALVRMFLQAVLATHVLPSNEQTPLVARLNAVRRLGHSLGYGVGDEMDEFLSMYFVEL